MRKYRSASGRTITQSLNQYGEKAYMALGAELYREGTEIQTASLPLVPVDTGALHNSSYVTEPKRDGDHITVEVGFGGVATQINPKTGEPTTAYALAVHENLQAHHEVGQAKYLEAPFDAARSGMSDRIIAGMKRRISGAGGGQDQAEGDGGQ